MPNMLDSAAIYMALFLSGTEYAIMIMAPEKSAAAPTPAIARPTINTVELVAAAHTTEPTSKMTTADR